MKMILGKESLSLMLGTSLIAGGPKSLLGSIIAEPKDGGIVFRDQSLDLIIVYHEYKRSFFESLELDGKQVPFTEDMLKMLKDRNRFVDDQKITVTTEGDEIIFSGARENYKQPIVTYVKPEFIYTVLQDEKFGVSLKFKEIKPTVIAKIKTAEFAGIPANKDDVFQMVADGEDLLLKVETDVRGIWKRKLNIGEKFAFGNIEVGTGRDYFYTLIGGMGEEFWLSLAEPFIVLTRNEPTMNILTALAPKVKRQR